MGTRARRSRDGAAPGGAARQPSGRRAPTQAAPSRATLGHVSAPATSARLRATCRPTRSALLVAGALPVALGLAALGCDPLVALQAQIHVGPGAAANYAGPYPAQLVVQDDHDTGEIGAPPHAHRVAILCAPPASTQHFTYARGGVGCAYETHLVAYLAPMPKTDEAPPCGAVPGSPALATPPPASPALGRAVAFAGRDADCASHEDHVELTLSGGPLPPAR